MNRPVKWLCPLSNIIKRQINENLDSFNSIVNRYHGGTLLDVLLLLQLLLLLLLSLKLLLRFFLFLFLLTPRLDLFSSIQSIFLKFFLLLLLSEANKKSKYKIQCKNCNIKDSESINCDCSRVNTILYIRCKYVTG